MPPSSSSSTNGVTKKKIKDRVTLDRVLAKCLSSVEMHGISIEDVQRAFRIASAKAEADSLTHLSRRYDDKFSKVKNLAERFGFLCAVCTNPIIPNSFVPPLTDNWFLNCDHWHREGHFECLFALKVFVIPTIKKVRQEPDSIFHYFFFSNLDVDPVDDKFPCLRVTAADDFPDVSFGLLRATCSLCKSVAYLPVSEGSAYTLVESTEIFFENMDFVNQPNFFTNCENYDNDDLSDPNYVPPSDYQGYPSTPRNAIELD
jgi:hypothetical protein